jgi:PTH1 family peptidyl-tRNA hydrolase
MKLIIGLGNPGQKYENTRHNIGFIFLDNLHKKWSLSDFKLEKGFDAEISQGRIGGKKIILVKPQKFMNLSGETVKKIMAFYKTELEDLLVIHDDIDITIGKFKFSTDSTSAGHKGVQNIIDNLNTKKFARLRIGIRPEIIDSTTARMKFIDFVLEELEPEELKKISLIESSILEKLEEAIA